jgi:hypothetical protein
MSMQKSKLRDEQHARSHDAEPVATGLMRAHKSYPGLTFGYSHKFFSEGRTPDAP